MKYFALVLFIVIAQPLPPLPRQTVNKQTEKTSAKSQVSNKGQNPSDPSPSIVVVNNCPNEDASTNAANNEASNLHHDAPKQPTPWSRSDELTLAYDILTGILVVIALGTGLSVAWQSWETRKAAEASSKGVDATIRAERAWVVADLAPMGYKNNGIWAIQYPEGGARIATAEEIVRGEPLRHRLKFANMGRTAARIVAYEYHSGFFDHKRGMLRIERIDYNEDYNRMLGAGNELPTDNVIDIHEFVGNPVAVEIGPPTWKNWMVVLVSVTYDHVFSSSYGPQQDTYRFVYDINSQTMRHVALANGDKEQIGKRKISPQAEDRS